MNIWLRIISSSRPTDQGKVYTYQFCNETGLNHTVKSNFIESSPASTIRRTEHYKILDEMLGSALRGCYTYSCPGDELDGVPGASEHTYSAVSR